MCAGCDCWPLLLQPCPSHAEAEVRHVDLQCSYSILEVAEMPLHGLSHPLGLRRLRRRQFDPQALLQRCKALAVQLQRSGILLLLIGGQPPAQKLTGNAQVLPLLLHWGQCWASLGGRGGAGGPAHGPYNRARSNNARGRSKHHAPPTISWRKRDGNQNAMGATGIQRPSRGAHACGTPATHLPAPAALALFIRHILCTCRTTHTTQRGTQVIQRSTHARPGMHTQQCSAYAGPVRPKGEPPLRTLKEKELGGRVLGVRGVRTWQQYDRVTQHGQTGRQKTLCSAQRTEIKCI